MGEFTTSVTIDHPADDVLAFLANPDNLPLWLEAVDHGEPGRAPAGVAPAT
jgi:uncharacterized protein YndB with AHSA1/START domain